MAKFPIVEARRELGVVPTTAVRANIDVRTGEGAVGAAIGQAGLRLAEIGSRIQQKRQQLEDTRSAVSANDFINTAILENKAFRNTTADTKEWAKDLQQRLSAVEGQIGNLSMSDDARLLTNARFQAASNTAMGNSLIAETTREARDTRDAVIRDVTQAVRSGDDQNKADAIKRFSSVSSDLWDDNEARFILSAAITAGQKGRTEDLINGVHAAMEAASADPNSDFSIPKELAKNPAISETQQTSLRSAISTAERARNARITDAQTKLVNETTSTTLREYFNGELSVATLNQRHEAGLVEDSVFKLAFQGLTETIPKDSDPAAAGNIRRAMASFALGSINRAEADKVIAENYVKLDGPDRSAVVADLEDVETQIIANAKANMYREGRGLMSQEFTGIKTTDDLINLFGTGLTDKQKAKINRKFTAEINNRDLYERAIDARFREMRKEGVSDILKFNTEGLRVLRNYERRKILELEQLEFEVAVERREILRGTFSESVNLLRPNGTPKGQGFFGELKVDGKLFDTDAVATEFSIRIEIDGKERLIPTLVPTLTKDELSLMLNDIIPNDKDIPKNIETKAIEHAKQRIKKGQSPFAENATPRRIISPDSKESKLAELEQIRARKRQLSGTINR